MASESSSAAEVGRRIRIEEEEMSNYTKDDLANDWEFKIVRSVTAAFRNPAVLEKLRQEESLAGWIMVEKFDNTRVRFKRPISARENDSRLPEGVDPYRTYYGISEGKFTMTVLLIVFGSIGAVLLIVLLSIILFAANLGH